MSKTTLSGPELKPASGVVKRLVILLHGVGADGNDLIGLAPMLAEPLPDTHFISPNAPEPCDMAPYGYQWFSLLDRRPEILTAGVKRVAPIVNQFIDEQRDRFKLTDEDVALIGFSQGTMTSLYAALRRSKPIAGIVGFSGALLASESLEKEITAKPPVCIIHGDADMVVPFHALAHAEEHLRNAGVPVEDHARPDLGHGIDPEGIDIAIEFLRNQFQLS